MQYCFCYQFHMSESRVSRDQSCFLPVPHVWELGVHAGPSPVSFQFHISESRCSRELYCFLPVPHVWEQGVQGPVVFLTSSTCLRAVCPGPRHVSYQFHMSGSRRSRAQSTKLNRAPPSRAEHTIRKTGFTARWQLKKINSILTDWGSENYKPVHVF